MVATSLHTEGEICVSLGNGLKHLPIKLPHGIFIFIWQIQALPSILLLRQRVIVGSDGQQCAVHFRGKISRIIIV
jgi:hypothetical protein